MVSRSTKMNKKDKVYELVKKFIDDNEISNESDVWNLGGASLFNLTIDLGNTIGWYQLPDPSLEELDPDKREWEYDGHGVRRDKKTFELWREKK